MLCRKGLGCREDVIWLQALGVSTLANQIPGTKSQPTAPPLPQQYRDSGKQGSW